MSCVLGVMLSHEAILLQGSNFSFFLLSSGAGRGKKSKAKKFDVHNPEHLKQRVKAKHASAASTPINHNVGSFVELKQQLKTLLKKPIIPKGVSRSFLTMNKSLPMVTGKDGKADVDLFHAER